MNESAQTEKNRDLKIYWTIPKNKNKLIFLGK